MDPIPGTSVSCVMLSERGKQLLVIDDYKFRQIRVLLNGEKVWRCSNNKCTSSVKTVGPANFIVHSQIYHSHHATSKRTRIHQMWDSRSSSSQQPKKKKTDDDNLQHELLSLARERFQITEKESHVIAKNWAFKLERMSLDQRRLVEKFINEILFEGETGTLHRNSVIINPTEESLCTCHIKRSNSPVLSIPVTVHEESMSDT